MEWWARVMHDRWWHGFLWVFHKSHHRPSGPIEANDIFPVLHAPLAAGMMIQRAWFEGSLWSEVAFAIGLGATLFGVAYVIVHDGYIHGRLPVGFLDRSAWMRDLRAAHALHHKHGQVPYGLFLGVQEVRAARERGDLPPA
jgi:beta-carotene 3-hydroxylase